MVTELVAAGNPRLKVSSSKDKQSIHVDELNQRIDELEDAIGQDNTGPIGRAFAIRAEASHSNTDAQIKVDPSPKTVKS